MPAYYYYSALRGTQSTVNGGSHTYNTSPATGSTWMWSGPTTSFVLTESNSGATVFNGDPTNERIGPNEQIGGLSSQTVTIDGTPRQAIWDYTFTVTDGSSTWEVGVIDVDLNNDDDTDDPGEDGYFLVFPDGFPPTGTPLTVGPIIDNGDYVPHLALDATPVCFAAGTHIMTPDGERPVETLRPGDLVTTADHGPQPLIWTGGCIAAARGAQAPVVIEPGTLGNARRLVVSPQHAVRVAGPVVELLTGQPQVLVRAQHLLGRPGIHRGFGRDRVRYHHLLFARHELVIAEGTVSESLYPGDVALSALGPRRQAEVLSTVDLAAYGPTARPVLSRVEAMCLPDSCFGRTDAELIRHEPPLPSRLLPKGGADVRLRRRGVRQGR